MVVCNGWLSLIELIVLNCQILLPKHVADEKYVAEKCTKQYVHQAFEQTLWLMRNMLRKNIQNNLNKCIDEECLTSKFKKFGKVIMSVKVERDKYGVSRDVAHQRNI